MFPSRKSESLFKQKNSRPVRHAGRHLVEMETDRLAIPGYFRGISPPSDGQKRKKREKIREKECLEKNEGIGLFVFEFLVCITS